MAKQQKAPVKKMSFKSFVLGCVISIPTTGWAMADYHNTLILSGAIKVVEPTSFSDYVWTLITALATAII